MGNNSDEEWDDGYREGVKDVINKLDEIIGVMDSFTKPKMVCLMNIIKEQFSEVLGDKNEMQKL